MAMDHDEQQSLTASAAADLDQHEQDLTKMFRSTSDAGLPNVLQEPIDEISSDGKRMLDSLQALGLAVDQSARGQQVDPRQAFELLTEDLDYLEKTANDLLDRMEDVGYEQIRSSPAFANQYRTMQQLADTVKNLREQPTLLHGQAADQIRQAQEGGMNLGAHHVQFLQAYDSSVSPDAAIDAQSPRPDAAEQSGAGDQAQAPAASAAAPGIADAPVEPEFQAPSQPVEAPTAEPQMQPENIQPEDAVERPSPQAPSPQVPAEVEQLQSERPSPQPAPLVEREAPEQVVLSQAPEQVVLSQAPEQVVLSQAPEQDPKAPQPTQMPAWERVNAALVPGSPAQKSMQTLMDRAQYFEGAERMRQARAEAGMTPSPGEVENYEFAKQIYEDALKDPVLGKVSERYGVDIHEAARTSLNGPSHSTDREQLEQVAPGHDASQVQIRHDERGRPILMDVNSASTETSLPDQGPEYYDHGHKM